MRFHARDYGTDLLPPRPDFGMMIESVLMKEG